MDFSVPPSSNFYQYAAGTWMKTNPIPAGYPSWNTFTALHVQSQERLKALLEELQQESNKDTAAYSNDHNDEAKVAAFYAAALDEDAIEQAGLEPLKPVLDLIEETVAAFAASRSTSSAVVGGAAEQLLGQFPSRFGLFPLFCISASPDHSNSRHSLCQISQGGLGLPDRDYYFDEDKQDKREKYVQHVERMLTLLRKEHPTTSASSEPTESVTAAAQAVYDLEFRLAQAHMTKTENRDPEATYNKMSIQDLTQKCNGAFDFAAYLQSACHGKDLGDVNVRNVAALQRVAEVWSNIPAETLRSYLQWRAVSCLAPYLPKAFVDENFAFYEKCLAGTQELKPRWKRAMAFTESALGDALGQLYCRKHFDESCKERALAIVENVRAALESRLQEVDWIRADSTRENALLKMASFRVKIGYPDKWIDYTSLLLDPSKDSFLDMVFRAEAFDHRRTVDEMNAPTDRQKWFMTPQTVNAYYHPSLNEIVFPAAILQPPFFTPDAADESINYGSMGAVVGHEMTHGFDDKGRKFNHEGKFLLVHLRSLIYRYRYRHLCGCRHSITHLVRLCQCGER